MQCLYAGQKGAAWTAHTWHAFLRCDGSCRLHLHHNVLSEYTWRYANNTRLSIHAKLQRTIAVAEVRVCPVCLVESVLPLHNHAQVLIVEDEHLRMQAFDACRGQLLAVHEEGAIAVHVNDYLLWSPVAPCNRAIRLHCVIRLYCASQEMHAQWGRCSTSIYSMLQAWSKLPDANLYKHCVPLLQCSM
jgi:hypothetical protein